MDRTEVMLVCPDCGTRTTARSAADPVACVRCGRPLSAADAAGAARPPAGEPEIAPRESEPEDGALIADLREAFGFDAEARGSADAASPGKPIDSSDAFSHVLGAAALATGTRLGDFEILGEIGRGGMGVVYRARQISLGREIALKVLPGYARHGRAAVERFRAEAQAAARLHHTNVVSIYAQGEHGGHYFYAMELVDGVSLDTVIRSRPDLLTSSRLRRASSTSGSRRAPTGGEPPNQATSATCAEAPPASATAADAPPAPASDSAADAGEAHWTRADYQYGAALLAEVADALDCAHRSGVIHRDVKPHNLLLGSNGRLHLTDFGLARLTDEPHLTLSGEIMGTPAYLSPEQVRGKSSAIDHRTDIYSLGVTLYELITRHKPFEGDTREQILTGICSAEPVAPRRLVPQVPVDLETICLRAMDKDPARRHPSAAVLAEDLGRFAAGRPILSRRTSRLEKAVKWARRHKAASAAIGAAGVILVLAVSLTWSLAAARQREAEHLVREAYEKLVYEDFQRPSAVADQLERAAALGADSLEFDLVAALAAIGATDHGGAAEHLEAALLRDPADLRALYMLAWAQRRANRRSEFLETFELAEERGPPSTADAWFLRGIAIQFEDADTAIESYRQANAWRAREHEFYPQALLHLARARNQQMYSTRSLEPLSDVVSSLEQLAEHGHYEAHPYYLLSIAYRLAAEVYRGSSGAREGSAEEYYARALEWARRGQELAPWFDRCIVAEAECLESMGWFEEAREARDRVIEMATKEIARCESYHYRWRLHYWLGDWDAALEDIDRHAACMPDSLFYAHFYPALVHAERGDRAAALEHARAIADAAPRSARNVLLSAACLRLTGHVEEADSLLAERAATVDFALGLEPFQSTEWMRALYEQSWHGGPIEPLMKLADQIGQPWKLRGEAYFHAAARLLADGDRDQALDRLAKAYRSFDGELRYTFHAKLIYVQMQQNPAWPTWSAVSWKQVSDISADLPDVGPGSALRGGQERN